MLRAALAVINVLAVVEMAAGLLVFTTSLASNSSAFSSDLGGIMGFVSMGHALISPGNASSSVRTLGIKVGTIPAGPADGLLTPAVTTSATAIIRAIRRDAP